MADFRFVANISISFDSLARIMSFSMSYYLIYTTLPGLFRPHPFELWPSQGLAGRLHNSATTHLVGFTVLYGRVLGPSEENGSCSTLPFRLVLVQKFMSRLPANDHPAAYYPN